MRKVRRARIATTLVFLANGSGIGAWAASIPALKANLALSDSALGVGLLAFAAGAIIAMPSSGWLAQTFGTARVTAAAGLGFALCLLLPGLAGSLPMLVAAGLILGAANGVCDVSMNAHGTAVERARGRPIMSSFHAAFSLGGLSGAAGGGFLLASGLPLSICLLIASGWVGALVLAALAAGLRLAPQEPAAEEAGFAFAWPGRALLGIGLLAFLTMLIEGAMADWAGVFLVTVAGASLSAASSGYAAFSVAMVTCRVLGDRLVLALGERRILVLGALLAFAGVALALAAAEPWAAIVGFGVVGLGAANLIPVLFSAAGRSGAAAPSVGVSMAATVGYAGFLIGPPAIGLLADAVGLRLALTALLAAAAVIALLAGPAMRPRHAAQARESRLAT